MTPDVVVDVGNSRIKYGIVHRGELVLDGSTGETDGIAKHAMFFDNVGGKGRRLRWLVAGVNPVRQAEIVAWARGRGDEVTEVTSYQQLPITVDVDFPEKVGIDRLHGAVAANRLRTPGRAAITVDVGTAMTINLIDATGLFVGGVIVPGPRLMAKALHDGTAKLPLVDVEFLDSAFPGKNTQDAITTGIDFALAGTVQMYVQHVKGRGEDPEVFVTGGGHDIIFTVLTGFGPGSLSMQNFLFDNYPARLPGLDVVMRWVPDLNLKGLLITAETLP